MNPPYSAPTSHGEKSKKGVSDTQINKFMIKNIMGQSSQQLFAQFIYRFIKLKELYNHDNIKICMFTSPIFLTGIAFEKFRPYFLSNFNYNNGMLFNAREFDGTSKSKEWGVSFTIWNNGETPNKDEFKVTLKSTNSNGNIVNINNDPKFLYNIDNAVLCSHWVREDIKKIKTLECLCLSSAIKPKFEGCIRGRIIPDAIGYINNAGNNVVHNTSLVGLYSTAFSNGNGLSIIKENFNKVISLFTARKTIKSNWINQKDEYIKPNIDHPEYNQWNRDCLIYSLFNNSSQQSSLRRIEYKDKIWDIKNEWFWMSNQEIQELANNNRYDELYQDARNFKQDRFVYNKLQQIKLSDDAIEILDMSKELIINSIEFRKIMSQDYPEYYLNTWDAGWYQIKLILKEYMKDELNKFKDLYKNFEHRMREGVYKFGFLK